MSSVPLGSCSRRMDSEVVSRGMLSSNFLTSCFCDCQNNRGCQPFRHLGGRTEDRLLTRNVGIEVISCLLATSEFVIRNEVLQSKYVYI
jgi:hypothetical protein